MHMEYNKMVEPREWYIMGNDIIDTINTHIRSFADRLSGRTREAAEPARPRLPGTIAGPLQVIVGGSSLAVFGGMSVGIGLAGSALGLVSHAFTAMTLASLGFFIPLSVLSGVLLGRGLLTKSRVDRLRRYLTVFSDKTYIMLDDLSEESGQTMKRTKKDVYYLLDHNLLPDARLDQQETCLLLTQEAIDQYESAMESKRIREEEARKKQAELEEWEELVNEEDELYEFLKQSEEYQTLLSDYTSRIYSQAVREKLRKMSRVLGQIFTCVKDHPDKVRLTRRLMHYYIPSVMKMLETYDDLEKQPIQGENIRKTRTEIEDALDTVNSALTTMFDELFQDIALDVSSDIHVMNTILERDGWKKGQMNADTTQEDRL